MPDVNQGNVSTFYSLLLTDLLPIDADVCKEYIHNTRQPIGGESNE